MEGKLQGIEQRQKHMLQRMQGQTTPLHDNAEDTVMAQDQKH